MMKPAPGIFPSSPRTFFALGAVILMTGCDVLTVSQTGRNIRDGNEAVVRGEIQKALQYYESALDGTMLSAEAHYRLGLVYEDQLKNEVGALHHFERYLELAPQGQFATDVKVYVERLRLTMVSRLSDGTVLPAREASRLKNENLELRKQLTELRQGRPAPVEAGAGNVADPVPSTAAKAALVVAATPPPTPAPVATPETEIRRALPVTAEISPDVSGAPRAEAVEVTTKTVRTYTVAQGDTLAGIARKFYRNSSQWPKIAEANKEALPDPTKLKVGMLLNIPE
jgi:LysM repeat protein